MPPERSMTQVEAVADRVMLRVGKWVGGLIALIVTLAFGAGARIADTDAQIHNIKSSLPTKEEYEARARELATISEKINGIERTVQSIESKLEDKR